MVHDEFQLRAIDSAPHLVALAEVTVARSIPNTIRLHGREEEVFDVFRVRGRQYFVLEILSRRGAYRVFDRHAGPHGDYRVLYRFQADQITRQRLEVLHRISGKTANRNFPPLIECTRQQDNYFVVLGWVWGVNLRDYLQAVRDRKIPRPSSAEVIRLMRGLVHGVSHYHRQANLVHGDISPANIVLTSSTKQLVLIDFGSAWPVEMSAQKEAGDGVTRPYAAPERLAGHAMEDSRSDQFSLAAIAYELLTLAIPYDGLGGQAGTPAVTEKCQDTYIPPGKRLLDSERLPGSALEQIDDVLGTSLALRPDHRYGTRRDWLAAWDNLYRSLQKGSRLRPWEAAALKFLETCARFWGKMWK